MEPKYYFLSRGIPKPVGFCTVFQRDMFGFEAFFLCIRGVCFVQVWSQPSVPVFLIDVLL